MSVDIQAFLGLKQSMFYQKAEEKMHEKKGLLK